MTSATDNRTTELRGKLDALDIEHFDYDKGGRTQTQWEAPDGKRHFTYETSGNPAKTARLVIAWHPTPEQAIAATLGDKHATHGTLTAEQVRKAIFNGSSYASYDGAQYYANGISMQAIADELNAELGSGTCENEWAQFGKFRCSKCWLQVDSISTNTTAPIPIKHCPNCGAKVVNDG